MLATQLTIGAAQVILIASKHKRGSQKTDELYRTEFAWGEVDNCWGQLGYVSFVLYKPPEYFDLQLYQERETYATARELFRSERSADVYVRLDPFGDMVAVALRNAEVPYKSRPSN